MNKIIIDEYSIYEIDEECIEKKKLNQKCDKENKEDEKDSGIE